MLNRRKFLTVSTLATGTVACGVQSQAGSDDQGELPPSIAALQPEKEKPRPITVDERRGRIGKARTLMEKHSLDGVLLTGGTSLLYFTGIRWGLSERLFAIGLPPQGRPFVVTPAFEKGRTEEQLHDGPLGDADVLTWQEDENPYAKVASALRDRGKATGRLGIEETVRFVFSDGVAKASPGLELTSATPVTAGCRTIKDAHELDLMRLASKITLKAYKAAYEALQEGMTQNDFRSLVSTAHERLGYRGGAGVQVGEASALPHGSRKPQTVSEGTILLIDGGCSVEGYRSDISRTFVLGTPSARMREVFAVELEAQTAALKAARPGVPCEEVDAAARNVIAGAGFGDHYEHFTHRVGHGIGMDGHEWPYLVRGNKLPLAPGMTFSDEPGIYLPGEFGVRLEDDMVITSDGAELMTPQSPSLEDPFRGFSG